MLRPDIRSGKLDVTGVQLVGTYDIEGPGTGDVDVVQVFYSKAAIDAALPADQQGVRRAARNRGAVPQPRLRLTASPVTPRPIDRASQKVRSTPASQIATNRPADRVTAADARGDSSGHAGDHAARPTHAEEAAVLRTSPASALRSSRWRRRASGFTRPVIRRKLERGAWTEVEPRVYRVAIAGPLEWRARLMALTLSSGGVASHASAAALYGLVEPPSQHEITVTRAARSASTAVAHSSTSLTSTDIASVDGIPATSPARTLIDLAGSAAARTFEDVLDLAIVTHIVTPARLRDPCPGAVGAPPARVRGRARVARPARPGPRRRRGTSGRRECSGWCEPRGFLGPRGNYRVHVGGRHRYLDLAWPAEKVAVEFDGFVPHSTRRVFDDDRVTPERPRRRRLARLPAHEDHARSRRRPRASVRSPAPSVKR